MSDPLEPITGQDRQERLIDQYMQWLARVESTDPDNVELAPGEVAAAAGGAWTNSAQQKESAIAKDTIETYNETQVNYTIPSSAGMIDPGFNATDESRKPNTLNLTLLKLWAENYPTAQEEKGATMATRVNRRIQSGMKTEGQRREEVKKSIEAKKKQEIRREEQISYQKNFAKLERMRWAPAFDGSVGLRPSDLTAQILLSTPA